jgi:hypothetical protein
MDTKSQEPRIIESQPTGRQMQQPSPPMHTPAPQPPQSSNLLYGLASVIAAIPSIVWTAVIVVLGIFIILAGFYNFAHLPIFINDVLLWVTRLLIAGCFIGGGYLIYRGYEVFHGAILDRYERQTARASAEEAQASVLIAKANAQEAQASALEAQANAAIRQEMIRRAQLQNEELEARIDLQRQLVPGLLMRGMELGQNIDYDGKKIRISDYRSNVHTIQQGTLDAPSQQLALPSPTIPTFRELVVSQQLQEVLHSGEIILNYRILPTGAIEMRTGTWLDLYSCGIGGVSGSGKTTTIRFILYQSIIGGASLLMIDPHIGDAEESLAAQFADFKDVHVMPPCDATPKLVRERVRFYDGEYRRRVALGIKGPPMILVIDELNAMMRVQDTREELAELLLEIAQEGRKFGLFAMLIGQLWDQDSLGGPKAGAKVRMSLSSKLGHRFSDENAAERFMGSAKWGRILADEAMPQGHYYFKDTKSSVSHSVTPNTVYEDMQLVRQLRMERNGQGIYVPVVESREHETGSETGAKRERNRYTIIEEQEGSQQGENGSESLMKGERNKPKEHDTGELAPIDPQLRKEAYMIIKLLSEGKNQSEIFDLLYNAKPGANAKYQQAKERFTMALALVATGMHQEEKGA